LRAGVGRGNRNSAGFWAKSNTIPPDLKCGFTLIFEVEVQKPGGIADPFFDFPSKSFKGPHFAH
jgi:hypothetical protein